MKQIRFQVKRHIAALIIFCNFVHDVIITWCAVEWLIGVEQGSINIILKFEIKNLK